MKSSKSCVPKSCRIFYITFVILTLFLLDQSFILKPLSSKLLHTLCMKWCYQSKQLYHTPVLDKYICCSTTLCWVPHTWPYIIMLGSLMLFMWPLRVDSSLTVSHSWDLLGIDPLSPWDILWVSRLIFEDLLVIHRNSTSTVRTTYFQFTGLPLVLYICVRESSQYCFR